MCIRDRGYTGQFTIYDDDDSKRMVRDIMQALGIEQKQFPINMIRSKDVYKRQIAMVFTGARHFRH